MGTSLASSNDVPDRLLLVCLLPARNAALDLPGYFDSVSRCCDAIVALDDGSTDETAEMLERHPLVKVVLRNPPRADYLGWDDAANRNRLLAAALELNPDWLISLDADERLDGRDAESLRRFLETDALPGCAYGFRHVPMHQDGGHFLPTYHWMFRLFSAAPGQRFPNQKLHFAPIPTSVPKQRWIRTTLRIQHFGELTAAHRLRRFHKYLLTDPSRRYQGDYAQLLGPGPGQTALRRWQPRPDSVPVLIDQGPTGGGPSFPALSVIVFAYRAEATIVRTLTAVVQQKVSEPFEVIVVVSGADRTAAIVRERFPEVTLVELDHRALPGEARNAGLAVASGAIVVFTEAHVEPLPGNLAGRLRLHRQGYAMVTGVAVNGTATPAGWASYFLDHAEKLPGHARAVFDGPPGRCSYARLPLLEVGGFPEGMRTGEDTVVNRALVRRGYVAVREPAVQLVHFSRCTTLMRLIHHHFRRGRGWGRIVVADFRAPLQLLDRDERRRHGLSALRRRLQRIEAGVAQAQPELAETYRRVRGLVVIGAVATWLGMWLELLRSVRLTWAVVYGRSPLNVLVVERGDAPRLTLVQIDGRSGEITRQPVADGVVVPHHGRLRPLPEVILEQDSKASLRRSVREALGVPALECLVVPRRRSLAAAAMKSPNGASKMDRVGQVVQAATLMWTARRRGTFRSTQPWWRAMAVMARLNLDLPPAARREDSLAHRKP